MKIRVPSDTTALSLNADAIAARIATLYPDATVERNGSRGGAWLEPLVELEREEGWLGFANMDVDWQRQDRAAIQRIIDEQGLAEQMEVFRVLDLWDEKKRGRTD